MKISLNDKRVFIILGFLGLAVIYYNFFYLNQQKDIKEYIKNIEYYEENSKGSDGAALRVAGIDTELKIFNEKMKILRSMFPPEITQENVLILIKKFSEESGFIINNIAFSEVKAVSGDTATSASSNTASSTVAESNTDTKSKADDKSEASAGSETNTQSTGIITTQAASVVLNDKRFISALDSLGIAYGQTIEASSARVSIPDGKGFSLGISISGTSSNKQLKDFLNKMKNFKNTISINNVQINSNSEDELLVNMEIEFFGIADKKAALQEDFFDVKWTPLDPGGKNDIFKPYEGYMAPGDKSATTNVNDKNEAQNIEEQLEGYDFSMRVLSFGADMAPPTVSFVGKSVLSNESTMPIVYGDNRDNENVDIYLETKDGKFYCKFKTDHEAFPEMTYVNLAQFKPSGNEIKMLIDSSKRVSTNDNAGVTITVTNKTQKNMVIDVVNDDDNRPRVVINKSGNNSIINYK
ncbi:hypothetical protein [Acetivibrio cellulolyticus]|uniref:hypothetical protein n=1 Tax=Acetivibrio cellulolyticus TaxID=35830 RepID=UPI0002481CC6|nr:hypothetical protein [Acetivibrio cellulolyticus]